MAYNYGQLKVLTADDSPLMRDLVRGLLGLLGINHIRSVQDADKAWSTFREFKPDLVITDWNMPPTDGMDFVKKMRTHPESHNRFVPIIVLTAYAEQDRVGFARDTGMTAFILKPVTAEALFKRVKMVVDDDRDFIKTNDYFGPDRRRTQRDAYNGPERRSVPRDVYNGQDRRK